MREIHKLSPSPSKWPALARSYTSIEPYIISAPADRLEKEPNQLAAYLRLTRKYKWVFITNALLCGLAAFVITRFEPAEYEANASVEINDETNEAPTVQSVSLAPASSATDATEIQTQIEILRSNSLVGRVVSALKLDAAIRPQPPSLKDRLFLWLGLPLGSPPTPREEAIAEAQKRLDVSPVRGSRLIKIIFTSAQPELAAKFVNRLTHEFVEQHLELRLASTSRTSNWLSGQLQELRTKLQRSEQDLQSYALESGLLYTGSKDRTNVADDEMRLIQNELSKAQADRIVKETRFELTHKSPLEALSEVLDDPSWRDYENRLTALRQQLADLKALYQPNYYKVQQLEAQVKELSDAVNRQRTNLFNKIENEYHAASRREELLLRDYKEQAHVISDQDAKAVRYNILKDEVDTNRQLYDAMLQKVKALGVSSAMKATNLAVVDAAEVPSSPVRPQPIVNLTVGLTTGIFFSFVFVLIRERSDKRFRAPGEAEVYLGLPELGVIPSLLADLKYEKRYARSVSLNQDHKGLLPMRAEDPKAAELATMYRSPSLMAEAFRGVLASILLTNNDEGPRVIAVTSARPQEGKTTVAVNLAIALTRVHRKVLMIDGDIRRPRLQKIFGLSNKTGLSDLLAAPAAERNPAIHILKDVTPGLSILTSGSSRLLPNNSLHAPTFTELITSLRREYDVILIDTPPLLMAAEARVISCSSDSVLLVVRMSATKKDEALSAVQRLAMDGASVLGMILNDYVSESMAYHSYYSYHQS